jgi:hypothetical protein
MLMEGELLESIEEEQAAIARMGATTTETH